jgi:hypothetical protein
MSHHSQHSQEGHGCQFSLSPLARRPRHHGGERVIIERVVEKSSSSIVYPMLTHSNYTEWSLVMKVNLQAARLWDVIDSGVGEYHDDRSVLIALLRAVPQEMQAGLTVKPTAHAAWEAIQNMWLRADRVKEANTVRLRREFVDLSFKSGESVEDFSLWLNTVASQLWALDDEVSDKDVIKRILHAVPDHLKQVAISMEMLLNLKELSIEEIVGHLRAVEQQKKRSSTKESNGRLLLMEEEWMARMKSREGSGSNTNSHVGRGNKSDVDKGGGKNRGAKAGRDDTCNYCGKKGHWAHECRKKKRNEVAQAHFSQKEEEEQSLLMAHSVVIHSKLPPPPHSPSLPPHRAMHITEQKVYANLGPGQHHDRGLWVLDTGATNHMTGSREVFAELDTQIYGTVKFGDGSITQIEGWGTIIITCKNGEHRTLTGVYFIPYLKVNIISIGQLDETGCRVVIDDGILRIYDLDQCLLVKVARDESRLYYLDLRVGWPICLAAHTSEAAW